MPVLLGRNSAPPPLASEMVERAKERREVDQEGFLSQMGIKEPNLNRGLEESDFGRSDQRIGTGNPVNSDEVNKTLGRGRNVNLLT
ncbi:MAG: hypothetical protein QME81_14315 [bacterium]|nr:hypothetical protein [bacterium]